MCMCACVHVCIHHISPLSSCDMFVYMSNMFYLFRSQFTFFSRDVSTAVSNLLQTTTDRWRHVSHSTQMYYCDFVESCDL